MLLFGATSADALYAVVGLLAAWPLASPRLPLRLAGALLLARRFAVRLVAARRRRLGRAAGLAPRRLRRDMLALGLLCGAVLLASMAPFAAATGFDPIGTLRATEDVYRFGDRRPSGRTGSGCRAPPPRSC